MIMFRPRNFQRACIFVTCETNPSISFFLFLLACGVRALGSVGLPSFTSLLTSFVPTHQTGKVLGGVAVVDTMAMSLSALIYGWVFSKTSATMPSAVFLMSAVCTCLSVLAGMVVWIMFKRAEKRQL